MLNIEKSLSAMGEFVQVLDANQSGAILLIFALLVVLVHKK
jgi:hypothetical protein